MSRKSKLEEKVIDLSEKYEKVLSEIAEIREKIREIEERLETKYRTSVSYTHLTLPTN